MVTNASEMIRLEAVIVEATGPHRDGTAESEAEQRAAAGFEHEEAGTASRPWTWAALLRGLPTIN
jgi:hypothetical protein